MSAFALAPGPLFSSNRLGYAAIWTAFALSGIVFIEPSPYDIMIIGLAGLYLLTGLVIPSAVAPMIVLLLGVILGGVVAAPLSDYFTKSIDHTIVTGYLAVASIFVACIVARDPEKTFRVILGGYVAAALIASVTGVIGYFAITQGAFDLFTENSRARGTFKDPNVFGPFLIPPALFCLHRLFTLPAARTPPYVAIFLVLVIGVLLSFSRAALGHLVVSILIMIGILLLVAPDYRFRSRLILWSAIAGIASLLTITAALSLEAVSGLGQERFQLVQGYDIDGRFRGQLVGLELALTEPLGIGYKAFSRLWAGDVHNVYLNIFHGSGWLGGFSYVLLVAITLARAFHIAFTPGPLQYAGIILAASFLPLALIGMLIDTDHWRHFFVLVGLIWGIDSGMGPRRPDTA